MQLSHAAVIQTILSTSFALMLSFDTRQQFCALLQAAASAATAVGNKSLAQLLLQHVQAHTDICAVSAADGSCPDLYQAARLGALSAVKSLLSFGVRDTSMQRPRSAGTLASTARPWDRTYIAWATAPKGALQAAIRIGSAAIVQQLLAAATPAQLSGEYGYSAVTYAITQGASPQIVQLLLDASAAVFNSNKTACVLTVAAEVASVEVAGSVLAAVLSTNSSTPHNHNSSSSSTSTMLSDSITTSSIAACSGGTSTSSAPRPPTVTAPRSPTGGTTVSTSTSFDGTGTLQSTNTDLPNLPAVITGCLNTAVTWGRTGIVELLLQPPSAALLKPGCKESALHTAVERRKLAIVKLLLQHGANVACKRASLTALHVAVMRSSTAVMKVLLDAGADPSNAATSGKTALQQAMQQAISSASEDEPSTASTPCWAAFDCLLSHKSQTLSAAELVGTAWSLAGSEHCSIIAGPDGLLSTADSSMSSPAADHNMPAWVQPTDNYENYDSSNESVEWPGLTTEEAALKRQAQHSMLCSFLSTAAAKDSAATQAALSGCIQKCSTMRTLATWIFL